ncbi:hypothetical protein ACIPY0_20370 [Paenarthrobacter nicotinovorans]|uniref:hypothetical protein n=1 Tax=Paenarthrobacter nicotinovorans TaxID=29320 RepID=UPI0037FA8656
MAREHARIKTAIWIDDDFLDLSVEAQHLYLVLTTQMTLSFCGVTSWHPGRLSQLATGWTPQRVEQAAEELSKNLYIVIDEMTGEVLVRSFIRNDEFLSSPNIAKAMLRAFSEIGSRNLRSVVVHELLRIHAEQPHLKGWDSCGDLLDKRPLDPSTLTPYSASGNPSEPIKEPFRNIPLNPSHAPYSLLPTPYSATPDSPQTCGYPADFDAVWALYPLKRDKKAAHKAWKKASKEVSHEDLCAGVVRYRDDPNRDPQFTKHFSTWLNAGSWDDEPLPARGRPQHMDHSARARAKEADMLARLQQAEDQRAFLEIED